MQQHATHRSASPRQRQLEQLLQLAVSRGQAGDLDGALAAVEQILAIEPEHGDSLHLLGLLLQQRGDVAGAVSALRRALQQVPDSEPLWESLALLLHENGRPADELECRRQLCRLAPDNFEAWHALGELCQALELLDEAGDAFQQALARRDTLAGTWNNLGNVRRCQGRGEEAHACYSKAIALKPDFAEAHFNLGSFLHARGRLHEARQSFAAAVHHRPDYLSALVALTCVEQETCAWDGREEKIAQLIAATEQALESGRRSPLEPFAALGLPVSAVLQRDISRSVAAAVAAAPKTQGGPLHRIRAGTRPPRLRIGYLSSDFREHATAQLMRGLFRLHDRRRFEVFAYSFGPDDGSAYRRGIAEDCDYFVDIDGLDTRASAERIAADGIHVLVDLKGYTRDIRPQIFALRPAPVQVNWLGFPGTTGADYMDYIITDAVVTPPALVSTLTEAPLWLPDSYQVNDHLQPIDPHTPTRAECGLPEAGFVFCCFNNSYKIEPEVFDVWMRLLRAVPDSVLWLLRGSAEAEANLRREAERRGVASQRLIFAQRQPRPRHLARHRCADLFLDTLSCNAHTTASDALWAGLPVLTRPGETFAARVAASLLHAVGLPELAVDSLAAYERTALELAANPQRLAALHQRLDHNRRCMPLFDTPRFARNLERAYAAAWARWSESLPPAPIRVDYEESRE